MFPILSRFADDNNYELILAPAQNQYPDLTLISRDDESDCFALDIKTTYRTTTDKSGNVRVSGMTLGTFGGYFRTRDRPISSTFAYNRYKRHYVLGVVYSRVERLDERNVYAVDDLENIPSVAHNFDFFLQEKYRIASDSPGSGNTKNIGSTKYLERLINGSGVFSDLGVEVFDDYWMNYRTRAMAREDGFDVQPYTNLKTYQSYKMRGSKILEISHDDIDTETDNEEY